MSQTVKTNILLFILLAVLLAAAFFVFLSPTTDGSAEDSLDKLTETVAQEQSFEDSGAIEESAMVPSWDQPTGKDPYAVRAIGNPDAPVKIEEFSSLTCGHCAHFHTGTLPQLKKDYIDTGKVYFIFTEYPLNGPALAGTMIARCLPVERYYPFITFLFETLNNWGYKKEFLDILKQNAKLLGASDEELNACLEDKKMRTMIGQNIEQAQKTHEIDATPSFVINDTIVMRGAQSYENFKNIIEEELAKSPAQESPDAP